MIDYVALAEAVRQGYDEDLVWEVENITLRAEVKARHEGLFKLDGVSNFFDEWAEVKSQRRAINQERDNQRYSFCIPRDFLLNLLYQTPGIHGLQIVFGSKEMPF